MSYGYGSGDDMPGTVIAAIIFMGINALLGLIFGLRVISGGGFSALFSLLSGVLWLVLAIGCSRYRESARIGALVLSGLALLTQLLSFSLGLGPSLIIFICLLTRSARQAFAEHR